jgi:hypothetical protein
MILDASAASAGVGLHAGWTVSFHRDRQGALEPDPEAVVVVSSDDHDGEIEATMPEGLGGGSYRVTVEGMSDADYLAIAPQGASVAPTAMKLHLYWHEAISDAAGYAGQVTGVAALTTPATSSALADHVVAILSVVSVTRRVGARHYETVITARERVFERLGGRLQNAIVGSPKDIVRTAAEQAGVAVEFHEGFDASGLLPASDSSDIGAAMTTLDRGSTYRAGITEVAAALEQATGRFGRGVLLIRDGSLHVGVRSGCLGGGEPLPLTPRTGLVEVAAEGPGPAGQPAAATETADATPRRRYALVLKGRPDLKPGALVVFDLPRTERAATTPSLGSAIAGPLVGPLAPEASSEITHPTLLYIDAVTHRLGRTSSFATTVAGIELAEPITAATLYDPPTIGAPRGAAGWSEGGGDVAIHAARAIHRDVSEAVAALRLTEAGEVRMATAAGDGSADDPPRHTETVWRGLTDPDGHPNRLARLPVRRDSPDMRERVPRVTPFAWGRTGLVLPRYPGTRVLLGHGRGVADDPVDLGALWDVGSGPDAQPGDWWLILPVGVAAEDRARVADDAEPQPHTGPVTQDLIDGDGNRVIEVGELAIRVSRHALADAGTRPERSTPEDAVTIEHVDAGSRIVMQSNGTVRIEAPRIEFDAGSDGVIAMTARDVVVSVANAMEVGE